MTTAEIEEGLETGQLVERFVSYYGDGAVLDTGGTPARCKRDDEGPTALVRVVMPKPDYMLIWHYCRGNAGPQPLSDAYEAAQIIAERALESEVWHCDVDWSPEECDHMGGCFLCGGDHRH